MEDSPKTLMIWTSAAQPLGDPSLRPDKRPELPFCIKSHLISCPKVFAQLGKHFVHHICRIHLHFFAGLKCCMLPMLQVMLSETNIDINAKFESKSPAKSVSRLFALCVCRVSMRAIGSVCRMSYICPKSSGLKVVQFTKTLDPAIGR